MSRFNDFDSFINFVENERRFSEKVSLDNMYAFCSIMGNPQDRFKSVHVAGTNGKGSVVAYLRDMAMAKGLKVATFTSPYIVNFNERIAINRISISNEDVLAIANRIFDHYDEFKSSVGVTPSFFEFITLMGFIYFAKKNVDLAIIEVGIGGLLDATNVIMPLACAITNIGYDHMNVLGNSLEEILTNKMGICKPHVPMVVGLKDKKLIKVAETLASKKDAPLFTPLLEAIEVEKCDLLSTEFTTNDFGHVSLKMFGFHQMENAVVALKTFEQVSNTLFGRFDLESAKAAIANTFWPGRLEVMSRTPLIVIDGGHNTDGVNRICEFMHSQTGKSKRVIFACSDNKEKEKMIKQIEKEFDEIIITSFTYKRHSKAAELFEYLDHPNKLLMNDLNEIINYVRNNPYDINLFLGSLYFVSEIRPLLQEQF